nr:dihydrolipoamide acetyltransferase family protein [Quisquiliibacterium transsilvanicum]
MKVPDIGEGVAEVELVEWLVTAGDTVAEDQPLAIVMTDKANVEIPSPVAGRVARLGGEVGQLLAVGAELVAIDTQAMAAGAGSTPAPGVPSGLGAPSVPGALSTTGASRHDGIEVPPVERVLRAGGAGAVPPAARPLASPSVRRHARELGVDLREVPGSGPEGRVRHEDVDGFAARRRSVTRDAGAAGAAGSAAGSDAASGAGSDAVQTLRMLGLRRRIAEATQEAWRRIPHFSYIEEVDVTELEALREALNARHAAARGRLTLLPFVLRAIVLAVREHPRVNARFDDEAGLVAQHAAVHAGIATHTEAGLLVPVLRHAEARDLWSMAAELARLAGEARAGRASRDELTGSTITVTSLGALGGIASTPVINRPEVAIVGVNRIVERAAIHGGAVVARKTMNLSSSFDHRVIDGMDAARFIQSVRGFLECPALLFVD